MFKSQNNKTMESNKNYNEELDSYADIINVFSNSEESLRKVSRFQNAVDQLVSNHKKMMDLIPLLNKDIKSSEKVKNKRRLELVENIMPVIRIMQVFAFDKKKKNLQNQIKHLTSDYVQNCSDNELIKISKKTWLVATKHSGYSSTYIDKIKSTLNPDDSKANQKFKKEYGLKPEMIKKIEESNIKFIESMLIYQAEMAEKEKLAIKMKKINKETKKLISSKIDRFALLFESQNPNFFLDYIALREKQKLEELKETSGKRDNSQDLLNEEGQMHLTEFIPKS